MWSIAAIVMEYGLIKTSGIILS